MRKAMLFSALILISTLAITWSLASNVHLKRKPAVAFQDNTVTSPIATGPLTLTTSGALTGLGNGDVSVTLSAVAKPTATCTNPGTGEHRPPGRNPALVVLGGTTGIPGSEIKNGNVAFSVTTIPPPTTVAGAPECPNAAWREDITDLVFLNATITVGQPAELDSDGNVINPGPTVFSTGCSLSGTDGPLSATCGGSTAAPAGGVGAISQ